MRSIQAAAALWIATGLLRYLGSIEKTMAYYNGNHAFLGRLWVSGLRGVAALRGPGSRAAHLVTDLQGRSEEFAALWELQEVGLRPQEVKHFVHPEVGALDLHCQSLLDPATSHALLVYTAVPGSESHERLRLLSVIGTQMSH